MATYCPEDLASRELCCPICFEDYDIQDTRRTPKLLLCLHTFCFECARKLWKWDGSLECSLCRMLHEQVTLDDLLDNHVIVQHLRREFEERDLEFARRIDQEMRDQERILTSALAEDASRVMEDSDLVVISDSDQDPAETTRDPAETTRDPAETTQDPAETTQNPVETSQDQMNASHDQVNTSVGLVGMFHDMVEDEEEEEEEGEEQEERNFILSNFFGELMEGINQMVEVTEGDNDDYDDDDDDDGDGDGDSDSDEEPEVIPEVEDQEEEDGESNGYHDEEEENTNPFFSFNNIHSLLGDAYSHEPIHTILTMSDNEGDEVDEGEDEEEEDERWHSASDDIINDCWANHEVLPIDDEVDEMEDDAPDIFDWHIITSESLLDD